MFQGKRAIVTGGSSGAGLALARALLLRGARVALVSRSAEKLASARASLASVAPPSSVHVEPCDVADAAQVDAAFERLHRDFGPPELLVTSAGILTEGRFDAIPLLEYRRVLDVNFFGTLHCVRAVVPRMRAAGGGTIVSIASVAGLTGVYGYAPYCASKHALVGLFETLQLELARESIRVHLVCPPEFESPMVDELEKYRSAENRALVRTLGVLPVDQVVDAVLTGIERRRFLIIPGYKARAATRFARWFPGISRAVAVRAIARARG